MHLISSAGVGPKLPTECTDKTDQTGLCLAHKSLCIYCYVQAQSKTFLCSTQQRMKFILLIKVKMPTNIGILTFMSTAFDAGLILTKHFHA